MSDFLQRFENGVRSSGLLSKDGKTLVAVSGGADSMVLLHALHAHAGKQGGVICVAHFNHQLRGRASDADERLVRNTAKRLGLMFFCGRADVKGFAERAKLSIEMAARKLRHEFLAATAREQKISTIALAHHADDQVEHFFLRLLRGTGGAGLSGMKARSPSPAGKKISLGRPLLGLSKSEILEYAREQKIRFREDTSNQSTDFLRNRIRNELLPLLRKHYQPGLSGTVLRLMNIAGAEAALAADLAQRWLKRPAGGFESLPVAVQRQVLLARLMDAGLAADFELVEELREKRGKLVSVGQGLSVARTAAGVLELKTAAIEDFNAAERTLELSGRAGRVDFGGAIFDWEFKKQPAVRKPFVTVPGREFFDAEKVGNKIVMRHWQAGDRFQPIGMKSASKLQDLFVNAKIPASQRRRLVVAATMSGELFWVEGLRIGEQFKLMAETRRQLVWQWRR